MLQTPHYKCCRFTLIDEEGMCISGSITLVWLQPESSSPKALETRQKNPPCCSNSQQRLFPTVNGVSAVSGGTLYIITLCLLHNIVYLCDSDWQNRDSHWYIFLLLLYLLFPNCMQR